MTDKLSFVCGWLQATDPNLPFYNVIDLYHDGELTAEQIQQLCLDALYIIRDEQLAIDDAIGHKRINKWIQYTRKALIN